MIPIDILGVNFLVQPIFIILLEFFRDIIRKGAVLFKFKQKATFLKPIKNIIQYLMII